MNPCMRLNNYKTRTGVACPYVHYNVGGFAPSWLAVLTVGTREYVGRGGSKGDANQNAARKAMIDIDAQSDIIAKAG